MTELLDQARALLAEATGRDAAAIPADASLDTFDGWTSLAHMRLVLAIESGLGRELPAEAILRISTLRDIAAHIAPAPPHPNPPPQGGEG